MKSIVKLNPSSRAALFAVGFSAGIALLLPGCASGDAAMTKAGIPAATQGTIDWTAALAGQLVCQLAGGSGSFAPIGANVVGASAAAVAKACSSIAAVQGLGVLTPVMPEPGTVIIAQKVSQSILASLNASKVVPLTKG